MEVFGIIMLIILATLGGGILIISIAPFIWVEIKSMTYNIKKTFEDRVIDIDERSETRQNRNAIKREKDVELANRKLTNKLTKVDAKLQKVDKQIEMQQKKLALAKELKKANETKPEMVTAVPDKPAIKIKKEKPTITQDITTLIKEEE